jgi:hypothetical protein
MAMAANNDKNEITNAMPKSVAHIGTPRGRALPSGRGLCHWVESVFRASLTLRWQWLELKRTPQISLAGLSILPSL